MAIFQICTTRDGKIELEENNIEEYSLFISNSSVTQFTTKVPILSSNKRYEKIKKEKLDVENQFRLFQNNVSSFFLSKNGELNLISSRFSRSKWFYIRKKNKFIFSNSLKELTPFSDKVINPVALMSILKFGETSEFSNIILGVHSVPVSTVLTVDLNNNFEVKSSSYYKVDYSFSGGDINQTNELLFEYVKLIADDNILMPISGGIDSTLINAYVNEFKDEVYPAYFVKFGKDDPELSFAEEAVKTTKADLQVCTFESDDFMEAFDFQTSLLDSPIGESSAIPLAHFFKTFDYENHIILDGTLADGCYGSKNYLKPPNNAVKNRSKFQQKINEAISSTLLINDFKRQDGFFPRDSYIKDEYLKNMAMYTGVIPNYLLNNAEAITTQLEKEWLWYYDMIDWKKGFTELDSSWIKNSIFKMIGYASRVTTAKVEDLSKGNYVDYPFITLDILNDQGKYTWEQKTQGGIIKYPLKKLLENYKSKEFIYRKKVGLNNSIPRIINDRKNKGFIASILKSNKNELAEFIPKNKLLKFINRFENGSSDDRVNNTALTIAIVCDWCKKNEVSLKE